MYFFMPMKFVFDLALNSICMEIIYIYIYFIIFVTSWRELEQPDETSFAESLSILIRELERGRSKKNCVGEILPTN